MRTLVLYASHYGSTKGIAERIGANLREQGLDVTVASTGEDGDRVGLESFDAYVVGSAVHAGHWLKPAVEFVGNHKAPLAARPAWLFSSGPIGEKYVHEPQPDPAEIAELRQVLDVRDHVVFAGAFDPTTADLTKGNWLERQVSKRFLPVGDFRDWPEIDAWANRIARELNAVAVAG